MGLFARFRRRVKPTPPLLSDAEMAKLNEEIFEEPVSIERLFAMWDAAPRHWLRREWVMDQRMFDRIRRLVVNNSVVFFDPPQEFLGEIQLIGLPIAIEPFAKLAIRERVRSDA